MSDTLLAFIYGLIAMLAFGISNGFSREISRKFKAAGSIVYRNLVVVATLLILLPFFTSQIHIDFFYILIGIVIVSISYLGLYFFYKALEMGDVGVVTPISSSRIILAMAIGLIFLGDDVNTIQIVAIVLIFIGLAFLSINLKRFLNSDILNIKSGVPYAFLAAVFWGVTLPLFSIPSKELGAFFFTLIVEANVLVISILQILFSKKNSLKLEQVKTKDLLTILLVGFSSAIASVAVNFGYATEKVSIVSAVSGANIMVAVLIGVLAFKERLNLKQIISILIIVGAVVVIGLTS